MTQSQYIQMPVALNLFSNATVSSGNQMLVAYQHFGNMRSLISTILRPELDMEVQWIRALTNTR